MDSILNVILAAAQDALGGGVGREAIWIALIANIALVLVALINQSTKWRKIEKVADQINDAVNHRQPGEPRLLEIVQMTHEQATVNARSHDRLGVDIQDIRHDLTRLDGKVDKIEEKLECVEDKMVAHIDWEEAIRYGGEHGASKSKRNSGPGKNEDLGQHDPHEGQGSNLFDSGNLDAS